MGKEYCSLSRCMVRIVYIQYKSVFMDFYIFNVY